FVSHGLDVAVCPPIVALGTGIDNRIIHGVIINHFEASDWHISAYGEGSTAAFLRAVGVHVYVMLGCQRMTMIAEHEKVVRYAERLGGKREGLMRSHFGYDRDGIVIGILRDEYRFMPRDVAIT